MTARKQTKGDASSWDVAGIRIRRIGDRYQVDGRRRKPGGGWEGRRVRVDTKAEAESEARAMAAGVVNYGRAIQHLSHRELLEATEALHKLNGRTSLVVAVEEWLRRHPEGKALSLGRACAGYLRNMQRLGRRPLSIYYMRVHFLRFGRALGWRTPFASLSESDFAAWIDKQRMSPRNARKHLQAARMLANFVAGRKREKLTHDVKPPAIWSPAIVEKVMRAAENHAHDFVAPLSLLFFAGCRPDEVKRMDWTAIDFDGGNVRISAEASKVRQARAVEMTANLRAWLARYARGRGPLVRGESWYRDQREAVMRAAGVKRWPVDVARHSFASYDYALHADAAATAAKLGHFGGLDMFARHYKGVATKREAEAFFAIKPGERKGEVIPFAAAAG